MKKKQTCYKNRFDPVINTEPFDYTIVYFSRSFRYTLLEVNGAFEQQTQNFWISGKFYYLAEMYARKSQSFMDESARHEAGL